MLDCDYLHTMEQAERIEAVLTKLKNALAESEALKKRLLERKRKAFDSDSEVESQASETESTSTPDASEADTEAEADTEVVETDTELVEKPIKKTWCCCFRKQKLN